MLSPSKSSRLRVHLLVELLSEKSNRPRIQRFPKIATTSRSVLAYVEPRLMCVNCPPPFHYRRTRSSRSTSRTLEST
jgi:hypothetical protein